MNEREEEQDILHTELMKEKLKWQKRMNTEAKNEWWKSILKFISGGVIAIVTGIATTYPKTSELETKITTLEKDVILLKVDNDSVKKANKILTLELKRASKSKTKTK